METLAPPIAVYLETGVFPIVEAARRIGNGGLSIRDAEEKPCAPSRSAPLPLERVLEQQRLIREDKKNNRRRKEDRDAVNQKD
ncbi:hypothetical protein AGMMS4952_16160 [Spirochaetia bacterium]|nr:hypothetical protein AGMMS4952_16160 [Spirochaetia bacterium]